MTRNNTMIHKFNINIPPREQLNKPEYTQAHEIIKNLWLGNCENLEIFCNENKIDIILNVAIEIDLPKTLINHKISIRDESDEDIAKYLTFCTDLINDTLNKNRKIYVCCAKGVSRSPTIVIAYLMKYQQKLISEYDEAPENDDDDYYLYRCAFNYVKSKRDIINPNIGFILTLYDYNNILKNVIV